MHRGRRRPRPPGRPLTRTLLLTAGALAAFAANSILCRLALGPVAGLGAGVADGGIDAASFTLLRLGSGALLLDLILRIGTDRPAGNWRSAAALFLYALPFSYAYISLGASTGALILFVAVQATMFAAGLRGGERPGWGAWCGWVVALGGLVCLLSPGFSAPSPMGSGLMVVAGVAWGVYSLRGRNAARPVAETAGNFLRAVPLAMLVSLLTVRSAHLTLRGVLLAVASGAVTSGLGYVVWYAALRGLTATRAATAQLAVPAIAALGGVVVLGEAVTGRLVVASSLILGGVLLSLMRIDNRAPGVRNRHTMSPTTP